MHAAIGILISCAENSKVIRGEISHWPCISASLPGKVTFDKTVLPSLSLPLSPISFFIISFCVQVLCNSSSISLPAPPPPLFPISCRLPLLHNPFLLPLRYPTFSPGQIPFLLRFFVLLLSSSCPLPFLPIPPFPSLLSLLERRHGYKGVLAWAAMLDLISDLMLSKIL